VAAALLLIRHASTDVAGKALAGRLPGVTLNEAGKREAIALAERLAECNLAAIYVSPRERARDTAAPLAARFKLPLTTCADLDEIDFGDWTGCEFQDLAGDERWRVWIERRSIAQPPNGEAFERVARRVAHAMDELAQRHDGQTIALVTHGDIIKAAVAHVLGLSLDNLERFEIAPASVSTVVIGVDWAQVRLVNDRGPLRS
jgi:probable phosphoglycerate mutase